VEVNQQWVVNGKEVPVKSILELIFDTYSKPVSMYSKQSINPFPADSLFYPLDFELSQGFGS
jgi:hypothetical protein